MIAVLLCACRPAPTAEAEVVFVRDGLLVRGGSDAPEQGWRVVEMAWEPGASITWAGRALTAPHQAECRPLFSQALGDVSRGIALGGEAPDTAIAFSPDEQTLAVGTAKGEIWVLDAWTGAVRARRRLTESMVKSIAWAPDGATLYAGEQSPDALVHALDPSTLDDRWTLRLADRIESSPAPEGADVFGVYTLPAAFSIDVLPAGELLVAAAHGWNDGREGRRNASQLLRISASGEVLAAWPQTPASITLWHPAVAQGRVAIPIGRSADGPPSEGVPTSGVVLLSLPDLTLERVIEPAPLRPWFEAAWVWEAVDIDDTMLLLGLGDGRVMTWAVDGTPRLTLDAGAPVLAGEVPISASVGHALLIEGSAAYVTSGTNIPYGAAAPDLRPPTSHPRENALWVVDASGKERWSWRGEHRLQGLSRSPDGDELVLGAGAREADARTDLFGAVVLRAGGEGPGASRLRAVCPTEGPVFFRHAATRDGRIAVAEHPFRDGAGGVAGAYRVTVLR